MKSNTVNSTKYLYHTMLMILLIVTMGCSNQQGSNGSFKMTIHQAAFMGDAETMQAHVDAGSDLNIQDEYGSTALGIAATFNKVEIAQVLIKGGADINAQSQDGSTPLHTAAFFGRTDIVKALIDAGATLGIRNSYGSTPLESVSAPFADVKPIYDQISKDLGPLGLKLDYDKLQEARPLIREMLSNS